MLVTVVMMMVRSLMTRLKDTVYRISKFFDGSLERCLRCLGCVVLQSHCLILKRHFEVLDTFLKSNVLLHFLDTVLAMEMDKENYFLDLAFLLGRLLLFCNC